MGDNTQTGSGTGAFSSLGGQQKGNVTYGVMPEQIVKRLQQGQSGEFIVIHRERQSSEPQVWSSGDQQQTEQLFRLGYSTALDKQPEPTR